MNRRRRGFVGQLIQQMTAGFSAVGWWIRAVVTYPYYLFLETWYVLFPGNRRGGSMGAGLLDALLTVPGLIWHYTYVAGVALVDMAQTWPRVMRLRDLAAGLPALVTLVFIVTTFFFLPDILHSKQEVINAYEAAVNDHRDTAKGKSDPEELKQIHEKMLLHLRALSQLNPDDDSYRFDIAKVYYMLGDVHRGQAIIERLAPRSEPGFAPAHEWLAMMLLNRAPDEKTYDDALAHLKWALRKDSNQPRIHFLIGNVYFQMYGNYRPQPYNPRQLTRNALLEEAESHLSQAPKDNPQVAMMLGRVHALQGRKDEALRDIASIADGYERVLKSKPEDVDTRLRLAQACRDIGDFERAITFLQEGMTLKPDPRLSFELSTTFFLMAAHQERHVPGSITQQYSALRLGFAEYPASPFIASRFLQGLVGSKDEAAVARATLQQLLDAPGASSEAFRGMANFLLGFDAQRRSLAVDARRHFDVAKAAKDDKIPNAIASLALANLQRRSEMLDIPTAQRLTEAALGVWPENPNLLMVRGWNSKQHKQFATALSDFVKALRHRPDDAVLHSMLSETYNGLGQRANAVKHEQLAKSAKAREEEGRQSKAEQPIIVPAPGSGR